MPNYRRANTKGGTYFFTVVTYRRQKFLCDDNVRTALRNGIRDVQTKHPFTIDGWVLLPDHLHSTAWMHHVRRIVSWISEALSDIDGARHMIG